MTAREKLDETGLRAWRNKTLDQMTDSECVECLLYIEDRARVIYLGWDRPTLSMEYGK